MWTDRINSVQRPDLYFAELTQCIEALALEFYRLPFEPYAPVRRQMLQLWKDVNARRKTAGLPLLSVEVLPLRRRVMKTFEPRPGYGVAG